MMQALYSQQGARFSISILESPQAQDFINAHAAVLDSGFQKVGMSDAMRRRLTRSDYIFSGIKTFHELNEAFPSLLNPDGSRKPFEQFLNDVRKIDRTYNRDYLRAEYNFVQSSAEMAAKWERFMDDGDRYNLQYRTAHDGRVRPEHAALHNVTLPITDPFWQEYYPPNGWNCFTKGTPVLTSEGWRPIEAVRKGNLVVGGSGKLRVVIGTHAKLVDEQLVRVVAEGAAATCTENHRFCTPNGWITAASLNTGDIIIQVGKVSAFHKIINAVCNAHTIVRYACMAIIREWKTIAALAIDNEVKGGDIEVDNINADKMAREDFKAFSREVTKHDFFGLAQWMAKRAHALRVKTAREKTARNTPFAHILAKKGARMLQLLGYASYKLAVGLGFPLAYMAAIPGKSVVRLRKLLSCTSPALERVNPLGAHGIATMTDGNAALAQDAHHGAEVHMPVCTQPAQAALLRDVPVLGGICDVHAFKGFNSFFDFVCHTFLHCRYLLVEGKVNKKKAETTVYNLSIDKDESFVVPVGITHNCRCTVVQVRKSKYPRTPHDEAMALGEEALQRDTKGIFRFNAGSQQKTMPDYNPYTISRCRDCDVAKGKGRLAKNFIPDNELCAACRLIRQCEQRRAEVIKYANGTIEISNMVNRSDNDFNRLMQVAKAFAQQGKHVVLTPKMTRPPKFDYDCIYGSLNGTPFYGKCPDLCVDGAWYEHEGFTSNNPKRAFSNMVNHGMKQADKLIIDKPELTDAYMKRIIQQRIKDGHNITEIWVIENGKIRILYKKSEE